MAVRQVAAMREVHAENRVARLQYRGIGSLVRLRTGMRLHVGVLGAEELFRAIASEILDDVDELATAVVALAGIAFGVLVRENAAGRFQNGFGGEVLARDQFQVRCPGAPALAELPRRWPDQPPREGATILVFCDSWI